MIIKVMTRKEPSFAQLIAYVAKDATDDCYVLTHNLLDGDRQAITAEFEANARLLRKHANGTVLFHDIVSITRSGSLGLERQKEILKEIARDYIARRAPDHLVFAGLHEDRAQHLHYHFVISANPVGEWKRAHLSKPELRKLQTEMEARVMSRYPELEQKPAMARKQRGEKLTQPGQELKRRTGNVPERERVTNTIAAIFAAAQTPDDLFSRLTDARMELYRRGKSVGVRDLETGRNHRLATLGLADAFKIMSSRIEAAQAQTLSTPLSVQSTVAIAKPQVQPPSPQIASPPSALTQPLPQPQTQSQPVSQVVSPPPPTSEQEQPVNILELAITGMGAIADALSITPRSVKPVDQHVNSVRASVGEITSRKRTLKDKLRMRLKPADAKPKVHPLQPVPAQTKNVRHAVNNTLDTDLSPDQVRILNDVRQLTYEERLAEINDARQQQEPQRDQQQETRLKR